MKPGDVYHIHIPQEHRVGREFYGPHLHVVVSPDYMLSSSMVMLVPMTSKEPPAQYRQFRIRVPAKELGTKGVDDAGNPVDGYALTDQMFAACKSRIQEEPIHISTLTPGTLAGIRRGIEFVVGIPQIALTSGPRPITPPLKRI